MIARSPKYHNFESRLEMVSFVFEQKFFLIVALQWNITKLKQNEIIEKIFSLFVVL